MSDKFTTDEAHELWLYASSTGTVWAQAEALFRSYERRMARGQYDPALAVKGLEHVATAAARGYSREFSTGRDWPTMFPVAVRREVAATLARDFESEIAAGNSWLGEGSR